MTQTPERLLEEYVLTAHDVCSRCFEASKPTSTRENLYSGSTPCGDNCGELGISMESGSISTNEMLHRGDNLLKILESEDIDLDSEAFRTSLEREGDTQPPREAIIQALECGLGMSTPRPPETESEESDSMDSLLSEITRRRESMPEKVAQGPITTATLRENSTDHGLREYLSKFDVPSSSESVLYLESSEKFVEDFDVENVNEHTDFEIAVAAVGLCWHHFVDTSPRNIDEWIQEMDDRFSQYVLSAAVLVGPGPVPKSSDNHSPEDSFRSTGFWSLVKEREAQPITSYMKRQRRPVTAGEIAEGLSKEEEVVLRILRILAENDTVATGENRERWHYVKPENREFTEPDR